MGASRRQVAFTSPAMDDFAAFLLNAAEFDEWAGGLEAGFFGEFTLRGKQQFFFTIRFAFGNGPVTVVLAREEWPARMRQKHLHTAALSTKQQQARAHSCLSS